MAWLKYQASHAHGYGAPEYVEFDRADAVADLEDSIRAELYDGVRSPKFEILEKLPADVMDAKIKHAQQMAKYWAEQALHLNLQRGVRVSLEREQPASEAAFPSGSIGELFYRTTGS